MVIKLNSFILRDNIIDKMKDQLGKTHTTGLEHGFIFCSRHTPEGDVLIDEEHCVGTECKMTFNAICKNKDETFVGDYHTHPEETSLISEIDIPGTCYLGIGCIGGTKDNEINCFITKKNINKDDCISDAKASYKKNLSTNLESDKIDEEREKLSKMIADHNRKADGSIIYPEEIDKEAERLSQLKDKLNDRIHRSNEKIKKYWEFRNGVTNKYFEKHRIM